MLWMYAVCGLTMLVCLPFFLHYKKALRYKLAASFKTLGTLCAADLAFTAAVRLDQRCWICFAALVLHAAADYVLEFNLYIGAGLFMVGHICYLSFFSVLFPVTGVHFFIVLCLLGIMAFVFWRWREQIGKRMVFFALYGVTLSVTCAFAIAGLTGHTLQGLLIAAGGALFFFSDSLLLGRLLFSASRTVDWIIMITYYAAQLLFGASCLLG
jgi:uncharacterized membrane protein YhhN